MNWADDIRTYGHIVVDEVQDLTPMQLRMVARRSLNGNMTVVGDIAQATGALAPDDWDDVEAENAAKPSVYNSTYGADSDPVAPKGQKRSFVLDPLLGN